MNGRTVISKTMSKSTKFFIKRNQRLDANEGKTLPILDYILAHASSDERPYLEVTIFGTRLLGLLDSGATQTILGRTGWNIIQKMNIQLNKSEIKHCRVANGEECNILGTVTLPFCLKGNLKLLEVLVVPDVNHTLILGTDFWRVMGIIPDLRQGEWKFSSTPEILEIEPQTQLSRDQRFQLDNLVDEMLEKNGE